MRPISKYTPLVVALLAGAWLSACALPVPRFPKEYVHILSYYLDGQKQTVRSRVTCRSTVVKFNPLAGHFESSWEKHGSNANALAQVAEGVLLRYGIDAHCASESYDFFATSAVSVVDFTERTLAKLGWEDLPLVKTPIDGVFERLPSGTEQAALAHDLGDGLSVEIGRRSANASHALPARQPGNRASVNGH